jgi:hypothetical protein
VNPTLCFKGNDVPINLIDYTDAKEGERGKAIGHLCDEAWEMPEQIAALEKWLKQSKDQLKKGRYAADIGYSPREGALGGGAVLSIEAMQIMVSIGMELYLSEYPPFEDE